jgi:hypothetical protein
MGYGKLKSGPWGVSYRGEIDFGNDRPEKKGFPEGIL